MTADLQVDIRSSSGGRAAARFVGEVDPSTVGRFREALDTVATMAAEGGGADVVADLSGLTYLDSAGVEVLFKMARRATLEVVAGPHCPVRRVLEVVSLTAVARLVDEPSA